MSYKMSYKYEGHTIAPAKLAQVVAVFERKHSKLISPEEIEDVITYDWENADEHQAWIDAASPEEISNWLANILQDVIFDRADNPQRTSDQKRDWTSYK